MQFKVVKAESVESFEAMINAASAEGWRFVSMHVGLGGSNYWYVALMDKAPVPHALPPAAPAPSVGE